MFKSHYSIGGDLEISPQINYGLSHSISLPQHQSYFSLGRFALLSVLKELGLTSIIIPSFICPDLVAFLFDVGITVIFYDVTHKFDIDMDSFDYVASISADSAVLVVDYYGLVDQRESVRVIRSKYPSFPIIQDVSHGTFLAREYNSTVYYGDFVFGSYRKILAVPDGAFVYPELKLVREKPATFPLLMLLKLASKALRGLEKNTGFNGLSDLENLHMRLSEYYEQHIGQETNDDYMSEISSIFVQKSDFIATMRIRRENYQLLYDSLTNDISLTSLFSICFQLNNYSCPYCMPVLFVSKEERDKFRSYMLDKNAYCSIIWDTAQEFVKHTSRILMSRVLCFPVDQRYSKNEMKELHCRIAMVAQRVIQERD